LAVEIHETGRRVLRDREEPGYRDTIEEPGYGHGV
jgi:hypothetical protein